MPMTGIAAIAVSMMLLSLLSAVVSYLLLRGRWVLALCVWVGFGAALLGVVAWPT